MAKPGTKAPQVPYSLRLPPEVWEAAAARAAKDGQTMTEVILTALRGHLGVAARPSRRG